jgi:hypothetical protein
MSKVLSLLEAASAALSEATYMVKDSMLPLPPSPPSPISPSATSEVGVDWGDCSQGYVFDEGVYKTDGSVKANVWNVPGNDEKRELVDGHLAKVAVANGSYGISVTRQTGPTEEVLGPLGYCVVDKKKWSVAKDISVGDVFYMTDSTDNIVYRGIITAQPVAGPFCPIRSLENSFTACLGLVSDRDLRSEVELVFKVDWKVYSQIGDCWKAFLEVVGEGISFIYE